MEDREQKEIDLVPTDYDHDLAEAIDGDDDSLLDLVADPVARRQPRFARLVELRLHGDALDSGHADETDPAA